MAQQKGPNDEFVAKATTLETQQTTHRWAAGKRSPVLRARRMCAATVDTPEPDTKWTQQPHCAAKHEMMRTQAVTSPTDLRQYCDSI